MLNKLTSFGKTLRKLRVDHALTLHALGKMTGVSAAFISALERGKSVPPEFINRVANELKLTNQQRHLLEVQAAHQANEVTFMTNGRSNEAKELAVAFARRFDSLSPDEVQEITRMLHSFSPRQS